MDIGVRVPCYRRWCQRSEVLDIAQAAEDLGFASLWVQDHLVAPVGDPEETRVNGLDDWMTRETDAPKRRSTVAEYYAGDDWWLDPFATWGFLAGVTERVRLASDIVVVPYRNAVVQAKLIGTLDVLSGGRMMIGTGSGHVEAESDVLGLDFSARARMHDEHLQVIRTLLSEPEASFDGEFTSFGRVRSLVRPVQEPCPPIYVGGHGRISIRRAARLGDGWLPSIPDPDALARGVEVLHEECEAAGRDVPPIALSLPNALRFPIEGRTGSRPTQTPDEMIDLLRRHEALGVTHVSLGFAMPTAVVYLNQIQRFADEVLPAFSASPSSVLATPQT